MTRRERGKFGLFELFRLSEHKWLTKDLIRLLQKGINKVRKE